MFVIFPEEGGRSLAVDVKVVAGCQILTGLYIIRMEDDMQRSEDM